MSAAYRQPCTPTAHSYPLRWPQARHRRAGGSGSMTGNEASLRALLPRPLPPSPASTPRAEAAKRGALRRAQAACIPMHVHTPQHIPTRLTNPTVARRMLHQPHRYTASEACVLACRTPQALWPPRGRREAATESCQGSCRAGRPGCCSGRRSLRVRCARVLAAVSHSMGGVRTARWPPLAAHKAVA